MGIGVIVHGYIACPGWGHQVEDQKIFEHNRRAIESIPDSDPEWPFMTKNMFSMLPLRKSLEICIPQYEQQLIYFAGSYKDMYALTPEWLEKFERLLSKLCWYSASAEVVGWSGVHFHWKVEIKDVIDRYYRLDPPEPPTSWSFYYYKMKETQITEQAAIDGIFRSNFHRNEVK